MCRRSQQSESVVRPDSTLALGVRLLCLVAVVHCRNKTVAWLQGLNDHAPRRCLPLRDTFSPSHGYCDCYGY